MIRIPMRADFLTPSVRLQLGVFATSAAVMSGLLALVAVWTFASGGTVGDLALPFGGALLALVAETLCLGAALRRVQRRMPTVRAGERPCRGDAVNA